MQELSNTGYDRRVMMNWRIQGKNSRGCIIVLSSLRSIKKSSSVSYQMKDTSEILTYFKLKSHEIHGTFYPLYLSPFSTGFFGKRLGF